jgi:hypothetical protein
MNRYILIAIAVIVPFCGFVAWGLLSTREAAPGPAPTIAPAPVAAPVPAVAAPAPVPAAAAPAPAPALAAAPAEAAPARPAELVPVDTSVPEPADSDVRRAVLEQVSPAVEACIEKMPMRKADKVMTGFDVQPDGTLANVRVKTHARSQALIDCVTQALQGAHVDPARGIPKSPMRHAFEAKGR